MQQTKKKNTNERTSERKKRAREQTEERSADERMNDSERTIVRTNIVEKVTIFRKISPAKIFVKIVGKKEKLCRPTSDFTEK